MSRRYGRNQRRRARERIKDLETALAMERSLLHYASEKLKEVRRINESINRIVRENTILRPPSTMIVDGPARDRIQLGVIGNPRLFYSDTGSIEEMRRSTEQACVILAKLEYDHVLLRQHAIVSFADRRWCYAISEEAAAVLARAGELEKYVAQVLARQISEDIKKAGEKYAHR